jgi:prephenate dehydratase
MTKDSPTVAIQGEEGSYHDIAARRYFGDGYVPQCKDTFDAVFSAVAEGQADYALSAVENSLVGSIPSVYDLLRTTKGLTIVGEIYLGIHHSLIGLPGAALGDITDVYSHPVALGQCTVFLQRELPHAAIHPAADTAGSAVFIRGQGKRSAAAIAGAPNAARLGLQILREGIEDNPKNCTRFLVLDRSDNDTPSRRQTADKTSLLIEHLDDRNDDLAPSILYHALGCFADQKIALTKVESRPVGSDPWRYVFYLDCLAGAEEPAMQQALQALTALGATWRELGTYRHGETVA